MPIIAQLRENACNCFLGFFRYSRNKQAGKPAEVHPRQKERGCPSFPQGASHPRAPQKQQATGRQRYADAWLMPGKGRQMPARLSLVRAHRKHRDNEWLADSITRRGSYGAVPMAPCKYVMNILQHVDLKQSFPKPIQILYYCNGQRW
jgi:hypothetical protein